MKNENLVDVNLAELTWKGEKRKTSTGFEQEVVKLVDASKEDLQRFKNHCITMLTNDDKKHPGRYLLRKIIVHQMNCCGVELFLRSQEEAGVARYAIIDSIKKSKVDNGISDEEFKAMVLSNVVNVSSEYYNLPISLVVDGCLDRLSRMDRSHITLTFLMKQGIWFSKEEGEMVNNVIKEQRDRGYEATRDQVVREMLKLPETARIVFTPSGMTLASMRSMLSLRSKKYSELTTDQLRILRERVLFAHLDDVDFHISQWTQRIEQINKVAELRGIKLS